MRVLVTGASGFVGRWLVDRMVERGDEVHALVRTTSKTNEINPGAKQVTGDICDPASLTDRVRGCDVVFHLAGIRRASTRREFFDVNAEGTRHICEAIGLMDTPARLVLAGSLAATGPAREGRPVNEQDPLRPFEWYGESKAEAERILAEYDGKLPWTVIRPPRILGAGDRENLAFFKLVARGVRLKIGGGPCPMSMVDVADVVDGLLLLAEKDEAVGEAFFISADEQLTLGDLLDAAAQALEVELRTLYLPRPVLWSLAYMADAFSMATGKRLPLNRKLARQLTAPSWACSNQKARETLGYRPKVSLVDAVKTSALWYREQGLLG